MVSGETETRLIGGETLFQLLEQGRRGLYQVKRLTMRQYEFREGAYPRAEFGDGPAQMGLDLFENPALVAGSGRKGFEIRAAIEYVRKLGHFSGLRQVWRSAVRTDAAGIFFQWSSQFRRSLPSV